MDRDRGLDGLESELLCHPLVRRVLQVLGHPTHLLLVSLGWLGHGSGDLLRTILDVRPVLTEIISSGCVGPVCPDALRLVDEDLIVIMFVLPRGAHRPVLGGQVVVDERSYEIA